MTALQEFHSQCKPPGIPFLFFLQFLNPVICSHYRAKAGLAEQRSVLGGKRKAMATGSQVRKDYRGGVCCCREKIYVAIAQWELNLASTVGDKQKDFLYTLMVEDQR